MEFAVCDNSASNYLVLAGGYSSQAHTPGVIKVSTTNIDDVVKEAFLNAPNSSRVIIKLDVEGAEIESIKGAKETLATRNTLIIFEDHRKDKSCKITTQILGELGLHVYHVNPETFLCRQITDAQELLPLKNNPLHGCNFLACRPGSEFDMEMQRICEQDRNRRDWADTTKYLTTARNLRS